MKKISHEHLVLQVYHCAVENGQLLLVDAGRAVQLFVETANL